MESYNVNADPQTFLKNGKPNIPELIGGYRDTVTDSSQWRYQQRDNYNVRHSFWTGQSDDGKKHGTPNSPAFPWEDASDIRTFFVDGLVSSDVDLLCTSLQKANLSAVPTEGGDMARSKLVSNLMRWMMFSQMEEIDDEAELMANYYLEKGFGVMGVFWDTKIVPVQKRFTLEDMAQLAPTIAENIQDKDQKADLTDLMQMTFPELSRRKAGKMITELRKDGETTIGVPEVLHQRPVIRSYTADENIFIPIGTTEIQKAPYLFLEDWYTPDQLRAKVQSEGWDKGFVEHVIDTQQDNDASTSLVEGREWDERYGIEGNNKTENIRLVCAYYKTNDEDGLTETWYTIYHPDVSEVPGGADYAKHERLDYRPARYPFVAFNRERISRRLMETRGYPEIARGWQDQIKIEQDSRIDRQSMATNPPFLYPQGRKIDNWGPGAKVAERRQGEYHWAEPPRYDPGSEAIEQHITKIARMRFGNANDEADKVAANVIKQRMVQKWLRCWRDVFKQVWSLYKQYGPDEQFFRVVGTSPEPQHMVKGDEHEKYDFYIAFDVPGLDPEYQLKQAEAFADIAMKYDRDGLTDWNELYRRIANGLDPGMAEAVIMPKEEATEKEVEAEKTLLTQMWSGMDVDLLPPFNVDLRQNVFQSWLTGSETIPAQDVQARLRSDQAFAARVQKHQQQIQRQQMNQDNAVIGATGAAQGNL